MPSVISDGVEIHYEVRGRGSPVLLLAGLAGAAASWGPQIELFAERHEVILPDHRGTGRSERTSRGMTIAQHALDMARVVEAAGCGPVHAIGSSTGGAIAQLMALDHRACLRTITLASALARADAFYRRQFDLRRRLLTDSGLRAATEANALFLFDPHFARTEHERVEAWVESASAGAFDPEIGFARIDMIVGHDSLDRLGGITTPTLVLVGERDFCTPLHFSRELHEAIPGAELVVLDGGHFCFLERPDAFHRAVEAFLERQGG